MSVRTWAYVKDGVVVNAALSTPENVDVYPFPYEEAVDVTDLDPRPGPGWRREAGEWFPPPPEDPAPEPSTGIAGTAHALGREDAGRTLAFTSPAAVWVTVPPGLGETFSCRLLQAGTGPVTLVPGPGVQLHSAGDSYVSGGQWTAMTIDAVAADVLAVEIIEAPSAPDTEEEAS